MTGEIKAIKLR